MKTMSGLLGLLVSEEPKVILKYALRNAVIPIVSLMGVGFGKLLGGALFVEIIFNRLGLGRVPRELPLATQSAVEAKEAYANDQTINQERSLPQASSESMRQSGQDKNPVTPLFWKI